MERRTPLRVRRSFFVPCKGRRKEIQPRIKTVLKPLICQSPRAKTITPKGKKEDAIMMDLAMVAILAVSFILVKLLADWCSKQLDK